MIESLPADFVDEGPNIRRNADFKYCLLRASAA